MVQILQPPKSFGAELAGNIGREVGEGLSSGMQARKQAKLLAQEDRDILEATGINLSGIRDPEARKAIMTAQLKGKQKEQEQGFAKELQAGKYAGEEGLAGTKEAGRAATAFNIENLSHENRMKQQAAKFAHEKELKSGKSEEAEQVRQIGQQSFNGIAKLLNKGNVGMGSGAIGFFGGETAEDTGEFQSLTGGLEAMMVDMVSRGTLSNTRFQYITETLLPKPTDTQSQIKGKLKGLAQILGLDASELTGKGSGKKPALSSFHR